MGGGNSRGFLTMGFEPGGFKGSPTGDPVGGVNLKNTLYEILGVFRHPSKVLFGKTEVSTHYIGVGLIQGVIKKWGETTAIKIKRIKLRQVIIINGVIINGRQANYLFLTLNR